MKKIIVLFFTLWVSIVLNAQAINNTPAKETIVYKAISKKTKKAYIIEYKIQRGSAWLIEEYSIDGYLKDNIKSVSDLYKNNIDIKKEVSNSIQIELENKRVVYSRTIEKYDFGTIRRDFDIRNTVKITDDNGELSLFSRLVMEQLARLYPLDSTKNIKLNMRTNPNESIKTVLHNNGIKSLLVNGEYKRVYEIEVRLEGIPMTALFPKMYMYVEESYPHRVIKFNNMTGMMESVEFLMTDYKRE